MSRFSSHRRNRSSGSSSSSQGGTPTLLDSDLDAVIRSRSESPSSWDHLNPNAIPLLPIGQGTGSEQTRQRRDEGVLRDARMNQWRIGEGSSERAWAEWMRNGKLGWWLWNTPKGRALYVALLLCAYGGASLLLVLMNRFILLTGVYKFPFPITTSLLELLFSQFVLYAAASVTRSFGRALHSLGMGSLVAPEPNQKGKRRDSGASSGLRDFTRRVGRTETSGGIFELKWTEVKLVLPLAVIYALKVLLSNLSFAYTMLPVYQLSRVASLPISMVLTYFLYRPQSLTVTTLSSCITMTLSLTMASLIFPFRFAIEGFLAGIFSTVFVAAYPVFLANTHACLFSGTSGGVLSGDLLGINIARDPGDVKEEARTAWKLLHYVNFLGIIVLFLGTVVSGELRDISRNCYILDEAWFWVMVAGASAASWCTFVVGFLLVRATTPLTVVMAAYPRAATQTVLLHHFKLPSWSWVGVLTCWGASIWYLIGRRNETGIGFLAETMEIEGERGDEEL